MKFFIYLTIGLFVSTYSSAHEHCFDSALDSRTCFDPLPSGHDQIVQVKHFDNTKNLEWTFQATVEFFH